MIGNWQSVLDAGVCVKMFVRGKWWLVRGGACVSSRLLFKVVLVIRVSSVWEEGMVAVVASIQI